MSQNIFIPSISHTFLFMVLLLILLLTHIIPSEDEEAAAQRCLQAFPMVLALKNNCCPSLHPSSFPYTHRHTHRETHRHTHTHARTCACRHTHTHTTMCLPKVHGKHTLSFSNSMFCELFEVTCIHIYTAASWYRVSSFSFQVLASAEIRLQS